MKNTSNIILMKCLLVAACLLFTSFASAQPGIAKEGKGEDIHITKDSLNRKVEIEFNAPQTINNLLVLVTDSLGETIFLENKYFFSGVYKHTVDLKASGKGTYNLKVIRDEIRVNRTISIQ